MQDAEQHDRDGLTEVQGARRALFRRAHLITGARGRISWTSRAAISRPCSGARQTMWWRPADRVVVSADRVVAPPDCAAALGALDRVVAPGRRGPGQGAGAGLFEGPPGRLLDLVVMPAQRREVAQAGLAAAFVGNGVVDVALRGGASAAWEYAGGMPNLDQVAQGGRGPVGECFPGVVAVAAG